MNFYPFFFLHQAFLLLDHNWLMLRYNLSNLYIFQLPIIENARFKTR